MEDNFYQSLIAELSETERPIFEALLSRIKALDGNIHALDEDEKAKLAELIANHNVTNQYVSNQNKTTLNADSEVGVVETVSAAEAIEQQTISISKVSDTERPTDTEFGAYLLDNINESLCQGGASTADAVRYAFHNRWMPEKLKDRDVCEELYYRFFDEIELANKSIQQQSPSHANDDTLVAVGLAWFTTLYQCYQLVEAEGDI